MGEIPSKKINNVFQVSRFWTSTSPDDIVMPAFVFEGASIDFIVRGEKLLFSCPKLDSDGFIALFALFDTLIAFSEDYERLDVENITLREVDSYLRDSNSTPSCHEFKTTEFSEYFSRTISTLKLTSVIRQFFIENSCSVSDLISKRNLVEQIKFLKTLADKVAKMSEMSGVEPYRLYDWCPEKQKLSIEVQLEAPLNYESQLVLKKIFCYFDGISEVKFVASE